MESQQGWERISELFERALERPPEGRLDWLAEQCGPDERLLKEVNKLLAAHDKAGAVREGSPRTPSRGSTGSARPDESIGPYRVISEIGRGGMGVVYKAEDARLGRFVALKFLPPEMMADQRARSRLLAEARAASALDHPNICTVYDIGETAEGRLYVVMAYYDGETLAGRLEMEGALDLETAVDIARQTALGLGHAHDAGVFHRDIKPSNILLTERGEVKVLDFGLATRKLTSLSDSGSMVGTVAYMSPEHTTGKKADHRSDLWSLGVSLYEMVAGRRPFEGEYEAAVLYAIAHEDPEPLSDDLPEWLRAVIMRLLAKTPDERFGDAGALLVALQTQTAPQAPPRCQAVRNAPSYLTRFFGRGEELEQLAALLAVSRLVTLSGPAGAGKTRLSLELAGNVASRFADGACFAPLAAIEDPELTASAIAKSVGMEPAAGGALLESLKACLANREMLLVLDNFEQILDAAPIVGELLAAAPRLKVLVTSRAPLGLEGERDFPAPPLEAPDLGGEAAIEKLLAASAIQLFVDRAQAVRPNFALTDSNASEVARLCKSLDGLPLAIELAAARTKLFSPKALLSKLSERLDVLKASSRGGPERHRTLRQAIAWSYDLLDERAQGFFRRMAVFNNGWTIEAAEALWRDRGDDALELLEALCDQSLARQVGGPQEQPRFLLLETIRTFGLDLLAELGEEEDARRRHAEHFLTLSETAAPKLTTAAAREWLDALEADHDNLRAALVWAEKQADKETALRLGSALWRFWVTRGYTPEGFERMKRIVSGNVENVSPKVLLAALHGFSTLSHYKGRMDDAIEASKKSLDLARQGEDQMAVAAALNNLGWVYAEITSLRPARGYSEEALELARRAGDTRGAALALNNLGWISTYEGDCNAARRYHEEGLELRRLIGDGRGTAFVQAGLAWAEEGHGDLERAHLLTEQAMRTMESIRDVVISGFVRLVQARIFLNQGLDEKVVEVTQHEVDHWDPGGHRKVLAWLKVKLGQALHNLGRRERARQLMRESAEIFEEMSCPWGGAEVLMAQAVAFRSEGDDAVADSAFRNAVRISSELGAKRLVCEALEGLAGAAVVPSSDAERLAVGLGAAEALRERLGARVPQSRREALAQSEDRLRAAVGEREFEQAKQRGRNAELDEVISLAADGG